MWVDLRDKPINSFRIMGVESRPLEVWKTMFLYNYKGILVSFYDCWREGMLQVLNIVEYLNHT